MVAEEPAHIEALEPAFAAGVGVMVTVTVAVLVQVPRSVATKVYVVVTVGLTTGFEIVEVNPAGLLVHA